MYDSARWDGFEFRPGDIVISTSPKSGTTWMQMLCALLVFQSPHLDRPLTEISPWLDQWTAPIDAVRLQQLALAETPEALEQACALAAGDLLDGISIRDAGFDERLRAGILRETWEALPERGAEAWPGFNYAEIEERANIYFEHHDRSSLERLLIDATRAATLLEVYGTPYLRKNIRGIHQIHSRKPSCAILEDFPNRDGALRFYFERDQISALLLLKFCGQP